jgi:hypothetical protein
MEPVPFWAKEGDSTEITPKPEKLGVIVRINSQVIFVKRKNIRKNQEICRKSW